MFVNVGLFLKLVYEWCMVVDFYEFKMYEYDVFFVFMLFLEM